MDDKKRNIREVNKDRILKKANTQDRKKRLMLRHIKTGALLLIIVLVLIFILLMTPLFNIRTIGVNGNNIVSISEIDSCLGDLVGTNITRVSKADVMKRLSQIPYIKDCKISKKFLGATLYIDITENVPAAYMNINGKILVLDTQMTVIDDTNSIPVNSIPQILGVDSVKYKLREELKIENSEKTQIIKTIISTASETGILNGITNIDVGNTLEITFSYEDRLDAFCGSSLELERKIRMFKETVTNASMNPDAAGTVDLSDPGNAIYNPESPEVDFLEEDDLTESAESEEDTEGE